MAKQQLPYDECAERAVLSAILRRLTAYDDVCQLIKPDDFFKDGHRLVYAAIVELIDEQKPVAIMSIKAKLQAASNLERAGGLTGLSDLLDDSSPAVNPKFYADIVAEKARLRRIASASEIARRKALQPDAESKTILDEMDIALSGMQALESYDPVSAESIVKDCADHMYHAITTGETGVKTGFPKLDWMIGGLQKTDLIILAGRPASGKTTLAMNMMTHAAKSGWSPLVFSIEMSRRQLGLRMISERARLDVRNLSQGRVTDDDYRIAEQVFPDISGLPLWVSDKPSLSIQELRSIARKHIRKNRTDAIMVDYLQLMTGGRQRFESRNIELSTITRGLKELAKELDLPLLVLSQMSRAIDHRHGKGKRPVMSDLRDSGAIEQDADLVIFVHRPDATGDKEIEVQDRALPAENMTELIISKHRNGPTGSVWMRFEGQFNRFDEVDFRDQAFPKHGGQYED
jgi:replicative DNA helicase